ncbi:MAG TPA: HEAT repeat domain-containing protein [Polyangiales bacterium]
MGIFDLFSGKKGSSGAVQKLAPKVADKRGMAPDRWEAIQALIKIDSEEAVDALLIRFTFYTDPTITDQEEKEGVFNAVVAKGQLSVPPLKRFLAKAESLSWPLKMLDRLLTAEDVLQMLLDMLSKMDTEYERDPQRKLQILAELETRRGATVLEAVKPFLADVHETARFHAVGAVLAQDNAEQAREALAAALGREESVRIRARILDGFAAKGWSLDPALGAKLPDAFSLDASGVPRRR